jgi:hypothetical protein
MLHQFLETVFAQNGVGVCSAAYVKKVLRVKRSASGQIKDIALVCVIVAFMCVFPLVHVICVLLVFSEAEKSSYLHQVTDDLVQTTLQSAYREIRPSVFLRKSLNNPLIDRVRDSIF